MKIKKIIINLIEFKVALILHLLCLVVLFFCFFPVAKWYYLKNPVRGIDFYNSVSYVKFLHENPTLRFEAWKDTTFSGYPFSSDYPALHFYLIQPLVPHFGLIRSVEIYMMGAIFLYAAFSYFLFWEISRTRAVALVLAIATSLSVGPYGALVWGGSLPFFATEMFYPLVLWLLVRFLRSKNYRFLFLSALATGIGVYGHPLVSMIHIVPAATILIFLYADKYSKFWDIKRKLLNFLIFIVSVVLIGYVELRSLVASVFGTLFKTLFEAAGRLAGAPLPDSVKNDLAVASTVSPAEQEFARKQIWSIVTQTNTTIFVLAILVLIIFLISVVVRKSRLSFLWILPALALVTYLVIYIGLYANGVPLFQGGWYRTFWAVPVVFSMFVAWVWGNSKFGINERFGFLVSKFKSHLIVALVVNGLILGVGALVLYSFSQVTFNQLDTQKAVNLVSVDQTTQALQDKDDFISNLSKRTIAEVSKTSIVSSSFPDKINTLFTDTEIENIKPKLIPPWIDPNSREYRLYDIDATVNIWWNVLYKVPLARGYIDPPINTAQRWGLFWLDSVMGRGKDSMDSSLEVDWKTPHDVVENNTKFLLDWYAVKYLEGNHLSDNPAALAQSVTSENYVDQTFVATVSGTLDRNAALHGIESWLPDNKQALNYYKLKDELTSPILATSNAPAVLLIGSDTGYDTMMRFLGQVNLNSQKMVLAKGTKYIDDYQLSDLKNFKAVVLYNYDYHDVGKSWRMIEEYLKKGGNVFVDTGTDVKEGNSAFLPKGFDKTLPTFFPIKETKRGEMGSNFDLSMGTEINLLQDVHLDKFSNLIYDGKPWNVSHTLSDSDLYPNAKVILRNKGQIVMAQSQSLGGKFVWSGLNLPYHIIRNNNPDEAQLFLNVLTDLSGVGGVVPRPSYEVKWISPQEIEIKNFDAKAVIFKEQFFDGWSAHLKSATGEKTAKLYIVGPSYPGFMYANLASEKGPFTLTFRYQGESDARILSLISLITILFLIDYIVLNKQVLGRAVKLTGKHSKKLVGRWWEKDEAE